MTFLPLPLSTISNHISLSSQNHPSLPRRPRPQRRAHLRPRTAAELHFRVPGSRLLPPLEKLVAFLNDNKVDKFLRGPAAAHAPPRREGAAAAGVPSERGKQRWLAAKRASESASAYRDEPPSRWHPRQKATILARPRPSKLHSLF